MQYAHCLADLALLFFLLLLESLPQLSQPDMLTLNPLQVVEQEDTLLNKKTLSRKAASQHCSQQSPQQFPGTLPSTLTGSFGGFGLAESCSRHLDSKSGLWFRGRHMKRERER